MTKDEALKLALEALESVTGHFTRTPSTLRDSEVRGEAHKAITAIREALADHIGDANKMVEQPEQQQKPYGYVSLEDANKFQFDKPEIGRWQTVYTTPFKAQPEQEPVAKRHEPTIDLNKYAGTYGGYTITQTGVGIVEPEQEFVAYQDIAEKCRLETVPAKGTLLHTSPPASKSWQGLTGEGIDKLADMHRKE